MEKTLTKKNISSLRYKPTKQPLHTLLHQKRKAIERLIKECEWRMKESNDINKKLLANPDNEKYLKSLVTEANDTLTVSIAQFKKIQEETRLILQQAQVSIADSLNAEMPSSFNTDPDGDSGSNKNDLSEEIVLTLTMLNKYSSFMNQLPDHFKSKEPISISNDLSVLKDLQDSDASI